MRRSLLLAGFLVFSLLQSTTPLQAAEKEAKAPYAGGQGGWSSFARGGGIHQFDTDLDDGGDFNVNRFTVQTGVGYSWDRQTNVSFSLGYKYDGYDFSGSTGLAGIGPWDDIHTISLGVPVRFGINKDWTAFVLPSIRSSGESGADFGETLTGGVLGGATYRLSDSLTIGPGIGVFSQLEDSATVIPFLLIDWRISDSWSLDTGRGLGATMGPGLTLNYQPNDKWRFGIGGRYEKLRFRLDENGVTDGGVGEDSAYSVYLSSTYKVTPKASISLVGGVEGGGELTLEDEDGRTITDDSYDTGLFLGFMGSARF